MPDRNSPNHNSVQGLLRARPRRGGIDLAGVDPSETNGVKRQMADERLLADEEHITSLQDC